MRKKRACVETSRNVQRLPHFSGLSSKGRTSRDFNDVVFVALEQSRRPAVLFRVMVPRYLLISSSHGWSLSCSVCARTVASWGHGHRGHCEEI